MKVFFARISLVFTGFILLFVSLFNGAGRAGSAYKAEEPANVRLNVAVVSDLHAADNLSHDRNVVLEKLFAGVSKSDTKLNAIVMPGDLTNNGTRDEYRCLAAILKRYNKADSLIPAIGNHDARGDMEVEDYETNMANYYTFCKLMDVPAERPYWAKQVNGYFFIVLGSEDEVKDRAYISDAQLGWLDEQLTAAEATGNPAFIVCHQVIDHTNDVDNQWWYDGSIGEQSDAVRDVIRSHTGNGLKVIFISGHLHQPFCDYSFEQPWENLYCLNLPSAQYNEDFGQGCMLEAYADRVLIRARSFITGEWLPYTWTVPLG